MDKVLKSKIINDVQIKKFSAYGFLKNLAFFKPYLVLYLMSCGLDLFEVGLLYSVREAIVYIFEVPSGIIADYYGRKKELQLCFVFYIISFSVFFFLTSFYTAVVAMVFYGLGEAFRSGTHKAMILTYLESKKWSSYKTFVYGRTRSFSLLGSALNSLIAIVIIVFSPSNNYIFAFSVLPYIADFALISTYPSYLDGDHLKGETKRLWIKEGIVGSLKNVELRKLVLSQGVFQSVLKSTRDTVQPIILSVVLSYSAFRSLMVDGSDLAKIVIGLTYFVVKLLSSYSSRNVYKLNDKYESRKLMNLAFFVLGLAITFISLAVYSSNLQFVILLFIVINVLGDARKPIYLEVLDEKMDKKLRATVMSVESQITAILVVFIAPMFGYMAARLGLAFAFFVTGIVVVFISLTSYIRRWR